MIQKHHHRASDQGYNQPAESKEDPECGEGVREWGSQAGQAGPGGKLGGWRRADAGGVGTYSQRTIKDVNTAVYTNLTASPPPQKGEPAGEKRDGNSEGLLEVTAVLSAPADPPRCGEQCINTVRCFENAEWHKVKI